MDSEISHNFIAGSLAGCVVRATLFPIDTVKTHMQTKGTTLPSTLRSLAASRSVSSLYRGISPALLEIGINRGTLMGISTAVKQLLPSNLPESVRDAAAGASAGCLKTVALHPLDTLTCRGQLGQSWVAQLWPPQLTLYNGIGPAVCRSAGGMAIWLSARNGLERSSENAPEPLKRRPWLRDWLVGATSSAVCDLCTFPLDTLKKNQQVRAHRHHWHAPSHGRDDSHRPVTDLAQAHGGGIGDVVRGLFRDGGPLQLYRGYTPRLVMVAINGALWNRVYVVTQEALRGGSASH